MITSKSALMKFSHFELKHTVIRVINFGGCFRSSCTILVLSPGLSPPQKPLSLCFDRRLEVGGWEEGQTEPRGSLFLSFAARIPLKYLIHLQTSPRTIQFNSHGEPLRREESLPGKNAVVSLLRHGQSGGRSPSPHAVVRVTTREF